MQIAKDKVVSIDYTLTDEEGTVLDSSQGREPLAYLHGAGNIIPGLENGLEGRAAGEQLQVKVAPKDGYGERSDEAVQRVPRQLFEGVDEIQPGMQFHAESASGVQIVTVKAVEDDAVVIDVNHPLAGVTLTFDVKIVEVRDASAEELEHGHVHGAGGHHH